MTAVLHPCQYIPRVSIIVPAYNIELYIPRCLDSIRLQTYTNFEVIVVNDGSIDHTASVVKKYLRDSRIRIIEIVNSGVSFARNIGLSEAQGEFVLFLDGDDWWDSLCLSTLVEEITSKKYDYCCCSAQRNKKGKFIREVTWGALDDKDKLLFIARHIGVLPFTGAMILRKDFILKNNISYAVGCSYAEDIELFVKVIMLGRGGFLPHKFLHIEERDTSAIATNINIVDVCCAYNRIMDFIRKNTSDKHKIVIYEKEFMYRKLPTDLARMAFIGALNSKHKVFSDVRKDLYMQTIKSFYFKFDKRTAQFLCYILGSKFPKIVDIMLRMYRAIYQFYRNVKANFLSVSSLSK